MTIVCPHCSRSFDLRAQMETRKCQCCGKPFQTSARPSNRTRFCSYHCGQKSRWEHNRTANHIKDIIARRRAGETYASIAAIYGRSAQTIFRIVWRHNREALREEEAERRRPPPFASLSDSRVAPNARSLDEMGITSAFLG
jgi:hypothetical protein